MRFGSLFSGVGGFDLGFERAGMTCAWQAENNKYANQVLATHWPSVKRYEDVRDVGRNAEAVELICGGFPCQDLSVAGKRAGLAGERSGLWFEFRRIVEELAPTWVVIENVPGLLSSNKGRDLSTVLEGLAQLGYGWAYRVLDSQYYGVAQRRRRVFIVGYFGDASVAAKVLFEPESRDWNSAPSRETGQSYSFSAGASPAAGSIGWQNEQSPTLKSARGSNSVPAVYLPEMVEAMDVRNLRSNGEVSGTLASKKSGGYSLNYQNPVVIAPRTFTVRGGSGNGGKGYLEEIDGGMTLGGQPQWLAYHENQGGHLSAGGDTARAIKASAGNSYQGVFEGEWCNGLHALPNNHSGLGSTPSSPNLVAPSLTASNDPSRSPQSSEVTRQIEAVNASGFGVRRLTPVECERLQGFPDRWTGEHSDTQRYKMMGNAVTVNVAEWIGKRIMEVDNA